MRHWRREKTKVGPKLSRHWKMQYCHSQRLTLSTKFYDIMNSEIRSQLVANIHSVVSELGA